MIVTRIDEDRTQKKKIYIDGEYAFFLYPKEMRQYKLKLGEELSEEIFFEIKQEVILKRAKRKMLALLSKKDYTCALIARRLRRAYYTADIIEEAISYGIRQRYLDDERYASEYIASKKSKKSLRQIEQELSQRGVAASIYSSLLAVQEEDEAALREKVEKYLHRQSGDFFLKKQKACRYFAQRGYQASVLHHILAELES